MVIFLFIIYILIQIYILSSSFIYSRRTIIFFFKMLIDVCRFLVYFLIGIYWNIFIIWLYIRNFGLARNFYGRCHYLYLILIYYLLMEKYYLNILWHGWHSKHSFQKNLLDYFVYVKLYSWKESNLLIKVC